MIDNNTQKIIINNINLKNTEYPKVFFQDKYYLDILINDKISSKSPSIKFNQFYFSYVIDLEISFKEQLDTILFKLCSEKTNNPIYMRRPIITCHKLDDKDKKK